MPTILEYRNTGTASAAARLLAGVLAALTLTSCAIDSDDPIVPPEPVAVAAEAKPEAPRDRDPRLVMDRLSGVAPCALIDPTVPEVGAAGFTGGELNQRRPHECEVHSSGPASGELSVDLGIPLSRNERFTMVSGDIDGAKAYFRNDMYSDCLIEIPVSFRLSVKFEVDRVGHSRDCAPLRAIVAAGIPKLDAPPTPDRKTVPAACRVLETALPSNTELLEPDTSGLNSCAASAKPKSMHSTLPMTGLELRYGDQDIDEEKSTPRQLGDRTVYSRGRSCTQHWRQGPSGVAERLWLWGELQTGCEAPDPAVQAVMRTLDAAPSALPTGPLTYRANEPDSAAAGACADARPNVPCREYRPVAAPHGAMDVITASVADPGVHCAIAADSVREHYGAGFRPTVSTTADGRYLCRFVRPDHSMEITVELIERTVAGHEDEDRVELPPVAGLPASREVRTGATPPATTVTVTLNSERVREDDEEVREQVINAQVTSYPARGAASGSSAGTSGQPPAGAPDTEKAATLARLLESVVHRIQ